MYHHIKDLIHQDRIPYGWSCQIVGCVGWAVVVTCNTRLGNEMHCLTEFRPRISTVAQQETLHAYFAGTLEWYWSCHCSGSFVLMSVMSNWTVCTLDTDEGRGQTPVPETHRWVVENFYWSKESTATFLCLVVWEKCRSGSIVFLLARYFALTAIIDTNGPLNNHIASTLLYLKPVLFKKGDTIIIG